MSEIVDYLRANPLFLVPILLMVAVFVFALLKQLLKLAAIVAIAGALYLFLVRYLGF